MMRYYVLSDIHGFYSLFQKTLREAGYFEDPEEKKLLLLGDLFDRGSEAVAMQEGVLRLLEEDSVILIRGNHEDLFEQLVTVDRGRPLRHHVHNGTYDTLEQLTGMKAGLGPVGRLRLAKAGRETPFYQTIIPAMRNFYETPHHVFVHAWVPYDHQYGCPVYREDWREAEEEEWREARWVNPMDAVRTGWGEEKTVICGHYHTSYGHFRFEKHGSEYGDDADFSPYYDDRGLIAIDACTAYSHQMNCLVIDD